MNSTSNNEHFLLLLSSSTLFTPSICYEISTEKFPILIVKYFEIAPSSPQMGIKIQAYTTWHLHSLNTCNYTDPPRNPSTTWTNHLACSGMINFLLGLTFSLLHTLLAVYHLMDACIKTAQPASPVGQPANLDDAKAELLNWFCISLT